MEQQIVCTVDTFIASSVTKASLLGKRFTSPTNNYQKINKIISDDFQVSDDLKFLEIHTSKEVNLTIGSETLKGSDFIFKCELNGFSISKIDDNTQACIIYAKK